MEAGRSLELAGYQSGQISERYCLEKSGGTQNKKTQDIDHLTHVHRCTSHREIHTYTERYIHTHRDVHTNRHIYT